jgi:DNA-binding transcriptional MerR regulator/quercetin dioxygenase-like cupin family protein
LKVRHPVKQKTPEKTPPSYHGNSLPTNGQLARPYLKIGDVARRVGVSPSVIRTWESIGLGRPQRTVSKYRLYTDADVKLLKRARYLRRVQGLNAPAILQMLRREGALDGKNNGASNAIGSRLRQLRSQRKLSLAQVARAAGISVGFLSAIERSHMSASVSTLRKLARFYRTNILEFFDPKESNSPLVTPKSRKVLEVSPGVRIELLAVGTPVMEAHLFRIAPGAGSGEGYSHEGEEFLYLLRGEFEITLDRAGHRLHPGDSFYFESTVPHRWSNPGKTEAQVLWVNTPPTF